MQFALSDFKDLASLWYNKFLPESLEGNKAGFVEGANIVYVNNVNLEGLRKKTMAFLEHQVEGICAQDDAIHVFAQEPKPVNNVRLRPVLKVVEGLKTLNQENRDRVFHMANRRYVMESGSVYLSQHKEMDDFLASCFKGLAGMKFLKSRFYAIQSLGMPDFVSVACGFFPKSMLKIQGIPTSGPIEVRSTNDVLGVLSDRIMKGKSLGSDELEYISQCKASMLQDIEGLL